jgi:signal transduction histidine kinase
LSLRGRLTIAIGGLILVSIAALGIAVHNLVGSQLNGRTDDELTVQVDGLERAIQAAPPGGEAVAARRFIAGQALSGSRLLVAQIPGTPVPISNQSALLDLTHDDPSPGEQEAGQVRDLERTQLRGLLDSDDGFRTLDLEDIGELRLLTRHTLGAGGETTVQAGEPQASTEQAQHQVAKTFLLIGSLTFLAAVGVALLIATRTSRPLEQMSERVAEVDAGRLDVRMEESSGVAEIAALAEGFDRMLDRLEASFASQRAFLADASHELRTPLTAILGQSQVLAADPSPDAGDVARVTAVIEREAGRMRTLIDGMLQLARLDSGGTPEPATSFDLSAVVAEVVSALPSGAADRVVLRAPDESIRAFGHREDTVRIVRNLIENALAYGRRAVDVEVRAIAGAVEAVVGDDGPGIEPADRDRVFERFSRLSESRSREFDGDEHRGFGLGLAISMELARGQGGTISVGRSDLGGARFTLSLPSAADGE